MRWSWLFNGAVLATLWFVGAAQAELLKPQAPWEGHHAIRDRFRDRCTNEEVTFDLIKRPFSLRLGTKKTFDLGDTYYVREVKVWARSWYGGTTFVLTWKGGHSPEYGVPRHDPAYPVEVNEYLQRFSIQHNKASQQGALLEIQRVVVKASPLLQEQPASCEISNVEFCQTCEVPSSGALPVYYRSDIANIATHIRRLVDVITEWAAEDMDRIQYLTPVKIAAAEAKTAAVAYGDGNVFQGAPVYLYLLEQLDCALPYWLRKYQVGKLYDTIMELRQTTQLLRRALGVTDPNTCRDEVSPPPSLQPQVPQIPQGGLGHPRAGAESEIEQLRYEVRALRAREAERLKAEQAAQPVPVPTAEEKPEVMPEQPQSRTRTQVRAMPATMRAEISSDIEIEGEPLTEGTPPPSEGDAI